MNRDLYWFKTQATDAQIEGMLQQRADLLTWAAEALSVLRQHQYCGDTYPDGGWPEVTTALAHYERMKRAREAESAR
jgi:hypothetical protein